MGDVDSSGPLDELDGIAPPARLGRGGQSRCRGSYLIDPATGAVRLIAVLATLGAVVLGGSQDLLLVITGFLLASVPLYALVGLTRTPAATEAALKTYLYGSLFGIVLMVGVVVLYGLGGQTRTGRWPPSSPTRRPGR